MANVTAGLGIQIYDNSYTGGANDKIARIISGKLQVETGVLTVNPISGSIQNIQGVASGFPLTIQGLISGTPITIQGVTSGSPLSIQGITSGTPLAIQGIVSGSPIITSEIEVSSNTVSVYGTSANVSSTASSIVTYYSVSAGTKFFLKEIIASASSGPVKVIVEYAAASTGPSSDTYTVGFFSSANPTLAIPFYQPIVATGPTYVRVTMRNDSAFTQDLYATIIGRLV